MILTVTPHPALDYTIRLDAVVIGRRAKYRDPSIVPSGKGVNVARVVRRLGEKVLALGFAAGETGRLLREGLDLEGIPHDFVDTDGLTRINVTMLTGPEGTATHLHGPGGAVDEAEAGRLRQRVAERLAGAAILVLSGSHPPGLPATFAAELVRLARKAGVPSILDAEGEVLAAGIGEQPDFVKINYDEASRLLGGAGSLLDAARGLRARGAGAAIVTRGSEGALAVAATGAWRVVPPADPVVRAVGAGDSFAAGLACGLLRGVPLPEALRLGAAAGAATARRPGTDLADASAVRAMLGDVRIEAS